MDEKTQFQVQIKQLNSSVCTEFHLLLHKNIFGAAPCWHHNTDRILRHHEQAVFERGDIHHISQVRSLVYHAPVQPLWLRHQSEEGVLDNQSLRLLPCFSSWWRQGVPALLLQERAAHIGRAGFPTGEAAGQRGRQAGVFSEDHGGGAALSTSRRPRTGRELRLDGAAAHSHTLQHLCDPWHQISTPGHKESESVWGIKHSRSPRKAEYSINPYSLESA